MGSFAQKIAAVKCMLSTLIHFACNFNNYSVCVPELCDPMIPIIHVLYRQWTGLYKWMQKFIFVSLPYDNSGKRNTIYQFIEFQCGQS